MQTCYKGSSLSRELGTRRGLHHPLSQGKNTLKTGAQIPLIWASGASVSQSVLIGICQLVLAPVEGRLTSSRNSLRKKGGERSNRIVKTNQGSIVSDVRADSALAPAEEKDLLNVQTAAA